MPRPAPRPAPPSTRPPRPTSPSICRSSRPIQAIRPANLFHLTGFKNQKTNEIWDTWIVGAPLFGKNVPSVLRVAVAADRNKDGIYNDAPAVVPDANHDGRINAADLKAYGVASNIVAVPFRISD